MKRFKNILYVLDGRSLGLKGSAEKVAELARLNEARVTVVVGDEDTLLDDLSLKITGRYSELKAAIHRHHCENLDQLIDQEIWEGIGVTADYDEQADFIAIIRKVLRQGHDLVIREAPLEQGIDQLAMRLVRKCPCPVWVMKCDCGQFRRILAAVNVGADYPETAALNRKIVELTHSLAQREGGEAHYLYSWRLEYEIMLRGPRFNVSAEEIWAMKKDLYEEGRDKLAALLNAHHIRWAEHQIHLREGVSSEVIAQAVTELDVDVLVMGSVARSGIPGLLIGNSAEKLLTAIDRSVLTVKPDGFTSPVVLDNER